MLYQVTTDTDAETGVGIDGVGVWHERLGWAYGLIASDPAVRAVALVRLADAERTPGMPWIGTT